MFVPKIAVSKSTSTVYRYLGLLKLNRWPVPHSTVYRLTVEVVFSSHFENQKSGFAVIRPLAKNLNFPDADFLDITTVLVRPRLVSSGPSFFRRTERAWLPLSAIPKPTTQRKMLVLPAAE
jgi:hypothetical protein